MIKWSEDLSVGIDTIDDQHKELFSRINDLVRAIKEHVCKYKIGDVINFLEDYVKTHFEEEERYMLRFKYPKYDFHRGQHEYFKRELSTLKPELLKLEGGKNPGSYELSVSVNQLVVDWILEHVSKVDKDLGKFLKTKV
ncbi:MAG: bacteriohemerythrin [Thermodesulfovibrionales bacterium]|nr:bacteriohemerythrin [Thermodesulfovibrionales bacterium]